MEAQAERSLRNLTAVLDAVGPLAWADVVKTTIFLADIADFAAANAWSTAGFMPDPPPARLTVQVAAPAQGRASWRSMRSRSGADPRGRGPDGRTFGP